MALGLWGQALQEAVQMSIVMELSMREYEAEAQLRGAAQVGRLPMSTDCPWGTRVVDNPACVEGRVSAAMGCPL